MKRLLIILWCVTALAANHYVRDGGTCSSTCSSWTDASDQITTAIANCSRGDTIWVADGSYLGFTFDKANSGTTRVTIKKATIASHGTETGWDNEYGNGTATLTTAIAAVTDYVTFDGQTRNESDWTSQVYGFKITDGNFGAFTIHQSNFGSAGKHWTVQYVEMGGPLQDAFDEAHPGGCFYFGGFAEVVTGWVITRVFCHNVDIPVLFNNADGVTIEYSYFKNTWQKESIRGQELTKNIIIRHNIFRDTCQRVPTDPAEGRAACTAPIAFWGSATSGAYDGNEVYGNVFSVRSSNDTNYTNGCILIGGTGGVDASNGKAYNNTVSGMTSATQCGIGFPGSGTGNVVRNNIWYDVGSAATDCTGTTTTCSNNSTVTNIFVNASTGDYRLTGATAAGYSLSTPYNVDLLGVTRGSDANWDLGAYEYGGSTPKYTKLGGGRWRLTVK